MAVAFLFVFTTCCSMGESKIDSVRKIEGVIEFDATIEIDPPLSPNSVVLFARCWVASNYYRVSVIWAEPNGDRMWFPIYPPTLRISSDPDSFAVGDDLFPRNNAKFKKPVEDRGVFVNMYGDYPVSNLRFADQEAIAERLYKSDLSNSVEDSQSVSDSLFPLCPTSFHTNREITGFKVKETNGAIESLILFGNEARLLKQCDYEYDNDVKEPGISRDRVAWPERAIKTGFREGAVTVKVAKTNYNFSTFDSTYESGGRISSVDYCPIAFGSTMVRLPIRITVRMGQSGEIVRSAQMTNFHLVQITAAEADRAAIEFAGFTAAEFQYRSFSAKYREKTPDQVDVADAATIKRLRKDFDGSPHGKSSNSLGEELKRIDMLIELNRIVGDESWIARLYDPYLSTLATHGLTNMIFDVGYSLIQEAVEQDRYEEADNLLNRWIEFLVLNVDIEPVIKFVVRDVSHGNLWSSYKLLDRFKEEKCPSSELRFARVALQSVILDALVPQLRSKERPKANLASSQLDWTAHEITSDQLEKLLDERMSEAFALLEKNQDLSPFGKSLKSRLDVINKHLAELTRNRLTK